MEIRVSNERSREAVGEPLCIGHRCRDSRPMNNQSRRIYPSSWASGWYRPFNQIQDSKKTADLRVAAVRLVNRIAAILMLLAHIAVAIIMRIPCKTCPYGRNICPCRHGSFSCRRDICPYLRIMIRSLLATELQSLALRKIVLGLGCEMSCTLIQWQSATFATVSWPATTLLQTVP